MASKFNIKSVHKDGKSELTIGVDENAKTIDGVGNEIKITNADGSDAKIAKENIPGMPSNVSDKNKLVTQEDLKKMMDSIPDIMAAANELAQIVGGIDDNPKEE